MAQTRKSTKKASAKKSSSTKKTSAGKTGAKKKTSTSRGASKPDAESSPAADKPAKAASAASEKRQRGTRSRANDPPNLTLTRGLAEIVSAHDLEELVYDTSEFTLTLRRSRHGAMTIAAPAVAPSPVSSPAIVVPPHNPMRDHLTALAHSSLFADTPPDSQPQFRERSLLESQEGEYHVITSPFVGTHYRRPSPDADTYVTLGSRVAKGQVLCIIEAMKLMNEIESDVSGTIADILVEDAQPVEYGQPLFKILVT